MNCRQCKKPCIKAGKQQNGTQKWYCKGCKKYQQGKYRYLAYKRNVDEKIVALLKEGCGIRSISRLLNISTTTVIARIRQIGASIVPPSIKMRREYELDEIRTFVQKKTRLMWVAYAIQKDTREVKSFVVGRRTNKTLKTIIKTLQLSEAKKIYTDQLNCYRSLIDQKIHSSRKRGTNNYIERKYLTLRTHLKRLNRRSICFSKSESMLTACLKIYFWK